MVSVIIAADDIFNPMQAHPRVHVQIKPQPPVMLVSCASSLSQYLSLHCRYIIVIFPNY